MVMIIDCYKALLRKTYRRAKIIWAALVVTVVVNSWSGLMSPVLYDAYDDKLECSCYLLGTSRNCINHHQLLAATATTIIHRILQLCPVLCWVLVNVLCVRGSVGACVCVCARACVGSSIMLNSVFFCTNLMWSVVLIESIRKCHYKFSGITVPSVGCIHNFIKIVKSGGSLLYKIPSKKYVCLPKKN
jgi:hypothetical protein